MDFPQPKLLVLSAPSGAGKSSIFEKVQPFFPNKLRHSISFTTRAPRDGEVDGVHYFFVDINQFKKGIATNDFIEWAEVHGNYYGTSKSQIESYLAQKQSVILDIDVQGALQLMELSGLDAEYIFLSPPSLKELEARLRGRKTETEEDILVRLSAASHEMSLKHHYSHQLINQELSQASLDFIALVLSLNGFEKISGKQTSGLALELSPAREIFSDTTSDASEKLEKLLPILQNLF
ncbi:MAG: guanylate kinase [SAR324 cluster bacterium]|nr:guanylate kinase [SAR324 cluster bacterium]